MAMADRRTIRKTPRRPREPQPPRGFGDDRISREAERLAAIDRAVPEVVAAARAMLAAETAMAKSSFQEWDGGRSVWNDREGFKLAKRLRDALAAYDAAGSRQRADPARRAPTERR